MATPIRLVKLKCPRCSASHWVIDNDFRGSSLLGERELDYDERVYECPQCGEEGAGFQVQKKTPVALTLRAHWLFEILARHLGAWPYRFQSGEFKGFTKLPFEHIISRLDEPIAIYSVRGKTVLKGKDDVIIEVVFEIRGPGSSERIRAAKSDHDGCFNIAYVPEGTYSFKATKGGFQSVVGTLVVSKKANRQKTIEIGLPLGG